MIIQVEINDVLVNDLAKFQGKETLTPDELCALVYQTIVDKASEFVRLSADKKMEEALRAINDAATARQAEITQGIVVNF